MLKPVEMTKISIVGPIRHLRETADILHQLNLIHIEDYDESEEYFSLGKPLKEASQYSKYLITLRSLLSYIGINKETYEPKKIFKVSELDRDLDKKIAELEEKIHKKINKIKEFEDELRKLEDEKKKLEPLARLGLPYDLLLGYKNIEVFIGTVKIDPRDKLLKITDKLEVITKEYEKEIICAVFVKKEYRNEVIRTLAELGFKEIEIPEIKGDFAQRLKQIESKISELTQTIEKEKREVAELEKENIDLILALEEHLSIETEKSELPLRIATSKYAFVIVGYIPKEKYSEVKEKIETLTKGKVTVNEIRDKKWKPPTAFKNPDPSKPFELLTTMYSIPKYYEVDPTLLVSLFFPFFFGLMLGDVAYGSLLLILSAILVKKLKSETWQKLGRILMYSGAMTIIFGLIYGEFFGFELYGEESILGGPFTHLKPVFHRLHEAPKLLLVTVCIGILHMGIGFILGIRNIAKAHGWKEAIKEKLNWLFALISIALIIFGFLMNIVQNKPAFSINLAYIGAIPFIAAWAILTILGEGPLFLIEYFTLLSNTISYARLLAVGLSSLGLAIAFNKIAFGLLWPKGLVGVVLAVLVLLIGHTVNLLLGILDPALQGLRLHYVEFFTKFFEGGGVKYNPFGRRRKFTEV